MLFANWPVTSRYFLPFLVCASGELERQVGGFVLSQLGKRKGKCEKEKRKK